MTAEAAHMQAREDKQPETPVRKKSWGRKIGKIVFRGIVSLIVLLFVAQMMWRFSGSNQWELALEKDGIKVYSLKSPGSEVVQFKAVGRIHSTVSGIVAWMKDPDACKIQGCTESYEVERVGDQLQYNYFQYDFSPFGKRDFMIQSLFYQNPQTLEVTLTVQALADKVPQRKDFSRVTNMNNRWRMRPLDNGMAEVEIENNLDMGGFLTNIMFMRTRPRGMYNILTHLEGWVNKEKYQTRRFDFLKEKNDPPTSAHISQLSTPSR